jgi:cell division protease FtsH
MRKETIEGLAQAIRLGAWHNDYMLHEAQVFLGCPADRIFRVYEEYVGRYFRNIIVTSLDAFLETNRFVKLAQKSIGSNGFQTPKKEDIEVAPKTYKSCLTEGCFFLEKENTRFILEFQNSYHNEGWWVTVFYQDTAEDCAKSFLKDLEAFAKEHNYLRNAKIDASLSFIPTSNYTWDDVVIPTRVKTELQLNIDGMISNIEVYRKNNIKFKRGIILQGPPGTGKTLIGKIICNSTNCTFLWVTPRFLERSQHVKVVCDMARELSPSILFLEDIDLYSEDRQSVRNASLLGELMNQLDGLVENHFIIVIATTNQVDNVETALRNRPGRFDRILDIGLPSVEGRLRMLALYTKTYKMDGVNLEDIAQKTDKYTGAHMKELVVTAAITAIDEKSLTSEGLLILKPEYFYNNIEKVRNKKIEPVLGFLAPNQDSNPLGPDDFD